MSTSRSRLTGIAFDCGEERHICCSVCNVATHQPLGPLSPTGIKLSSITNRKHCSAIIDHAGLYDGPYLHSIETLDYWWLMEGWRGYWRFQQTPYGFTSYHGRPLVELSPRRYGQHLCEISAVWFYHMAGQTDCLPRSIQSPVTAVNGVFATRDVTKCSETESCEYKFKCDISPRIQPQPGRHAATWRDCTAFTLRRAVAGEYSFKCPPGYEGEIVQNAQQPPWNTVHCVLKSRGGQTSRSRYMQPSDGTVAGFAPNAVDNLQYGSHGTLVFDLSVG